jgi:hypothetical protein
VLCQQGDAAESFGGGIGTKSPQSVREDEVTRVPTLVLALFAASLSAQVLPDAPSHSRAIPRDEQVSWWAFTAVDVAATVADAAVSTRAHFQPGIGHCHEGNPLFGGPYPSARRVWVQQVAGVAGLSVLTWWLKKRRHPWWGVLTFADAAIHTVATANTASNCF